MARHLNIEILKLKGTKHTAVPFAVCALLLALLVMALPGTQAQYATTDQDVHVFVFAEEKDVKVTLEEPSWTVSSGIGLSSGTTKAKDPTVANVKEQGNGCYMRVNMRVLDENGNTLNPSTNKERIDLILQTIWSDPNEEIKVGSPYTLTQLESMQGVNKIYNENLFEAPVWNSEMQAYNINYKGILDGGETARIFDKVSLPADYTDSQIAAMGNYYINIWVQAIQAEGFDNQQDALANLSNENVINNITTS